MTAIVLLFPHRCITDHEEWRLQQIAPFYDVTSEQLELMFRRITTRAKWLRKRADKTYLVVHQERNREISPLSSRFVPMASDTLIVSGVEVGDGKWQTGYPDWQTIVGQIPAKQMIVGGFHYDDCLQKFSKAARKRGIEVLHSPALTEQFYFVEVAGELFHREQPYRLPRVVSPDAFKKIREQYASKLSKKLGLAKELIS